jgi:proteasome lid subunit RPN8/RPN11
MDPQEQLNAMMESRRNGSDVLAFYHSHPQSEARPSQIDVRMAIQSGWLDVTYFVVSLKRENQPGVRAFRITHKGEIVEQEFEVIQSDSA